MVKGAMRGPPMLFARDARLGSATASHRLDLRFSPQLPGTCQRASRRAALQRARAPARCLDRAPPGALQTEQRRDQPRLWLTRHDLYRVQSDCLVLIRGPYFQRISPIRLKVRLSYRLRYRSVNSHSTGGYYLPALIKSYILICILAFVCLSSPTACASAKALACPSR